MLHYKNIKLILDSYCEQLAYKNNSPLLTDDHIDQKISCICPHRERIFNVSREHKDGKTIFHFNHILIKVGAKKLAPS